MGPVDTELEYANKGPTAIMMVFYDRCQ